MSKLIGKPNAFPKVMRLNKSHDFSNLRLDPSRFKAGTFIIFYKKNEHNISRLGLSISRKFGKACTRNYYKRIIREYFRQDFNLKSSRLDFLVVLSARTRHIPRDQLTSLVIADLKRFSSLQQSVDKF